jgi:hypothetical protein
MPTYVVQKGDYAGEIARKFTGDARRWPEFCAANPQLAKHATAGCVVYAGKTVNLPASWSAAQAAAQVVSSMPLLPDGRPVAELVTTVSRAAEAATAAAATPTVVTIERGTADAMQMPMDTITAAAPAPAKTGVSPLLRWSLIGGSIVLVGGVMAWLVLRSGGAPEVASNGPLDWLKHKIGLRGEGAPRANARRRKKGGRRSAKKGGRR